MDSLHTFVVLAYKESRYLEECIKSVLNQSYKSKVVIATTTDNKFIRNFKFICQYLFDDNPWNTCHGSVVNYVLCYFCFHG